MFLMDVKGFINKLYTLDIDYLVGSLKNNTMPCQYTHMQVQEETMMFTGEVTYLFTYA